ncbi:hypothetical protein BGZ47_008606 [Haplosporangium gracile]|nr:hypothetical protein BGZ47_008606 [Haplosporangium gracile]
MRSLYPPFSKEQIESYVDQYILLEPQPWRTQDYMDRLTTIPNLLDLVKTPLLLSIALDVLPGVTEGKHNMLTIKVTRVQFYDNVAEHRLEDEKGRLKEDRNMLDRLINAHFISKGIDYSTRLAQAIFDKNNGKSMIHYVGLDNKDRWKKEFFGPQPRLRLLR